MGGGATNHFPFKRERWLLNLLCCVYIANPTNTAKSNKAILFLKLNLTLEQESKPSGIKWCPCRNKCIPVQHLHNWSCNLVFRYCSASKCHMMHWLVCVFLKLLRWVWSRLQDLLYLLSKVLFISRFNLICANNAPLTFVCLLFL